MTPINLSDGMSRAMVHPSEGGALGRYDLWRDRRWEPILCPGHSPRRPGPLALGCNLLIPFSNRLSGGGFHHGGRFHPVEPSLAHTALPTHGNALTQSWTVEDRQPARVVLTLRSDGPGPFRYSARVTYTLEDGTLSALVAVRNTGPRSLPFGVGFHPWFPRGDGTRVTFTARGFWSADAQQLPKAFHLSGTDPEIDFRPGAPLPDRFINTAFTGWDGRARIDWPDRRLSVAITADPSLTTLIVYAPDPTERYLCVEPVSHSIDSHNDTRPGSAPPRILAPGEVLHGTMTLTPLPAPAG